MNDTTHPAQPVEPTHWRSRLSLIVVLLLVASFATWGTWWLAQRYNHSITDDAFVDSHLINIAPQVSGDVVKILVQEQMPVRKGQLLAIIDPKPYQRTVEVAEAEVAVAEAALAKARAELDLMVAVVPKEVAIAELKLQIARDNLTRADDAVKLVRQDVDQGIEAAAQAVEAAKATYTLSEEDYVRYAALVEDQAIPVRKFEEATKIYKNARAELEIAQARLGQARAGRNEIGIAEQDLRSARFDIAESEESVELARLGNLRIEAAQRLVLEREQILEKARRSVTLARTNLEYTEVRAPYDGVIARKWRHLGDYAGTGEPIFSMYNPALLYVTVHLEETLLEGVAPGNWARLDVDAFSEPFRGRVLWIGSATDGNFSLIPRDVSSGEFTYVVQRVPTRIAIEKDDRFGQLRPGLSVTVTIDHGPGDPDWARNALLEEARIAGIASPEEEQP